MPNHFALTSEIVDSNVALPFKTKKFFKQKLVLNLSLDIWNDVQLDRLSTAYKSSNHPPSTSTTPCLDSLLSLASLDTNISRLLQLLETTIQNSHPQTTINVIRVSISQDLLSSALTH